MSVRARSRHRLDQPPTSRTSSRLRPPTRTIWPATADLRTPGMSPGPMPTWSWPSSSRNCRPLRRPAVGDGPWNSAIAAWRWEAGWPRSGRAHGPPSGLVLCGSWPRSRSPRAHSSPTTPTARNLRLTIRGAMSRPTAASATTGPMPSGSITSRTRWRNSRSLLGCGQGFSGCFARLLEALRARAWNRSRTHPPERC